MTPPTLPAHSIGICDIQPLYTKEMLAKCIGEELFSIR